ncbi:MAG: hypothetical protein IKT81_00640 [Clostridia bacterium]|nr:hypothetical protein [Clostridia bacterium]
MEWKKAKWLIIAMLLAVNIVLAVNIAYRYTRALGAELDSLRAAVEIAPESYGFEAALFEQLPRYLYEYTGSRDLPAEAAVASAIVHGECKSTDEGGGVFIYNSPGVERVLFRRGGNITGIVSSDENIIISDVIVAAAQKSGLQTLGEGDEVEFYYDGTPISNAYYSHTVYGEHTSLTGIVPFSTGWARGEKGRSRGEMVLVLKNIIEDHGLGAIKSVKAVYFAESVDSKTHLLTPAWQVECQNGGFTVSIMDKSVLELSVN